MIILFGAVFYCLNVIFSAVLVAMRKTLSQVVVYTGVSILGTIISYPLINSLSIKGASITYFICMSLIAVIFALLIIYNLKKSPKKERTI